MESIKRHFIYKYIAFCYPLFCFNRSFDAFFFVRRSAACVWIIQHETPMPLISILKGALCVCLAAQQRETRRSFVFIPTRAPQLLTRILPPPLRRAHPLAGSQALLMCYGRGGTLPPSVTRHALFVINCVSCVLPPPTWTLFAGIWWMVLFGRLIKLSLVDLFTIQK